MPTVDRANFEALRACLPKMSAAGSLRSFETILRERDNRAIEDTTLFSCHKRYVEFVSSRLLYVARNDLTIIDINAEQLLPRESAPDPCDSAFIKDIKNKTIRMLPRL